MAYPSSTIVSQMEELLGEPNILSKQYQTLFTIISSGKSKEFLGREISLKDLDSMDNARLEAYYKIYELNYASKIGESLISGILTIYSKAVNKVLPIDNVEILQQDLNNDYILTNELKNITGVIASTCGKLLSLFTLGVITFKHIKIPNRGLDKELDKGLDKELDNELNKEHDFVKNMCNDFVMNFVKNM